MEAYAIYIIIKKKDFIKYLFNFIIKDTFILGVLTYSLEIYITIEKPLHHF